MLTRLLRTFLRPFALQSGLVVVLLIAQAGTSLYLPDLNADIINNGVVTGDPGYIWRTGGVMLGIVLLLGVIAIVTVYFSSRVSMGVGASLRAAIYRRVQDFSAAEMSRIGIPSLITRNMNDVQQVQMFLQSLNLLVIAAVVSVGGVIMAVREDFALSLLLVVAVPAVALVLGVTLVALIPLLRSLQVKTDRINQVLREQITGVRVMRAFLRTGSEQDRFRDANADITRTALRVNRIAAVATPGLMVILNLSSVGVLWFGGLLVSEGKMPIGNLTAFLIYILQILVSAIMAVTVVIPLPRAVASAERIAQVLDIVPAITDPACPVIPARTTGVVEFRHATFGYPSSERPVLNDLTFLLEPGQTSAIIGGTGIGKTTVLNLIARFFDVTGGAVLVNGADVREQSAGKLRSTIGLVPQKAFLFGGTVGDNLRLGAPDVSDDELWRVLDVAQALDFVASMPGGLDAPIDPGGANVSGGQRQRLSIARALARCPRLYLFDDCFSALDVATEARLRHALRAWTQDATVVVVAQRVSTVMDADQIIVLDASGVAGIGSHWQLMDACPLYQEIVASQLGEQAAV